jgi:hypothetical protein
MNNYYLFITVYSLNLKMIGNQIGDNGASFIGESLKVNQSLQQLDLDSKIFFSFNKNFNLVYFHLY